MWGVPSFFSPFLSLSHILFVMKNECCQALNCILEKGKKTVLAFGDLHLEQPAGPPFFLPLSVSIFNRLPSEWNTRAVVQVLDWKPSGDMSKLVPQPEDSIYTRARVCCCPQPSSDPTTSLYFPHWASSLLKANQTVSLKEVERLLSKYIQQRSKTLG